MKRNGEKISMLFVTTPEEAAAANAAGIHMLSIEGRFFDAEMCEAAGDCFVQVGLPYGGWGRFEGRPIATAEDYLRAAFHYAGIGGDAYYCSASYDIQKTLCDNHLPVVGHIGLIPSYITWTGWRAVGKNHKPRHGKMYRNFAPELECLQSERIAAFKEFKADVDQGGYPGAEHSVVIQDDEFDPFMKRSKANGTHRCCWIQNRRLAFSYAICCRSEELRTGGHCRACR